MAAVAVSMALTPVVLLVHERVVAPRVGTREAVRAPDALHEDAPVIIAGFGRFGHIVGRLLQANGVRTTVLDNDSDRVDLLRRLGMKVFYGDASRHDLLEAAGAGRARLLVLAIDSPEKTLELVHTVHEHFPASASMRCGCSGSAPTRRVGPHGRSCDTTRRRSPSSRWCGATGRPS